MENWETLIKILEKNKAYADFVAECVYAYIVNYSFEKAEDKAFANELVRFIETI